LVTIGVYLTFRVLSFPDLSVEGTFPLGGATAAVLIVDGVNPFWATLAALGAAPGDEIGETRLFIKRHT
jgi:putative ABC transport system permease protein